MYSIYYRNVLQEISGDLRGEEKGTFLPESESERRRCQNGRSPQPCFLQLLLKVVSGLPWVGENYLIGKDYFSRPDKSQGNLI